MLAWLLDVSNKQAGLALVGLSLLTACGGLPAKTSGHIGCAEADITIENESRGWSEYTWTARCHGKTFYCSTITGSNDSTQTSCKEADPGIAPAANAPAAPAATTAAPAPSAAPAPPSAVEDG